LFTTVLYTSRYDAAAITHNTNVPSKSQDTRPQQRWETKNKTCPSYNFSRQNSNAHGGSPHNISGVKFIGLLKIPTAGQLNTYNNLNDKLPYGHNFRGANCSQQSMIEINHCLVSSFCNTFCIAVIKTSDQGKTPDQIML